MCLCMSMCRYKIIWREARVRVYSRICLYVDVYEYVYVHVLVYRYAYANAFAYVYVFICRCMSICRYLYICVRMCLNMQSTCVCL